MLGLFPDHNYSQKQQIPPSLLLAKLSFSLGRVVTWFLWRKLENKEKVSQVEFSSARAEIQECSVKSWDFWEFPRPG